MVEKHSSGEAGDMPRAAAIDSLRPEFPIGLAAIAFTDVAGSVGILSRDKLAVHRNAMEIYSSLFYASLQRSEGAALVNPTGDGHCGKFPTATDSVYGMMWLQREMRKVLWPGETLKLRVGIDVGEFAVIRKPNGDDDVLGMPANLAARIMGIAAPGQILMSDAVAQQARQVIAKEKYRWTCHGQFHFKGLESPVVVWEISEVANPQLPAPAASKAT